MPDETAPTAPASRGRDGPGPLLRLSLRTKALVIASEYTHRQMEPNELAQVLSALAPSAEERVRVARAVEEELRAARYPVGEILRLMGELVPKDLDGDREEEEKPKLVPPVAAPLLEPHPASEQEARPSGNEQVMITQKVRAPHLMPFERYEFEAPEAEGPATEPSAVDGIPAEPSAEPAPPTRAMPVAGKEEGGARPAAGAGPAPFSVGSFKRLIHVEQKGDGSKPVVLVADDDASARVMYRLKLEQAGYAVREAKDGVDAWKQIRAGGIQYLVTDMKMPGYHGLEILGRMVDAHVMIPVVVVSAFDQLEKEFVVSTYPKLKFLTKPVSPDQVAAAVTAFARAETSEGRGT